MLIRLFLETISNFVNNFWSSMFAKKIILNVRDNISVNTLSNFKLLKDNAKKIQTEFRMVEMVFCYIRSRYFPLSY